MLQTISVFPARDNVVVILNTHVLGDSGLVYYTLYIPPAIIPAPMIVLEKATWNCTAKYAPEDSPEIEIRSLSTL